MTPIEAIQQLDELRQAINRQVSQLGYEADDIGESWALLGQQGAQRDDHAAMLLARLRPHLRDLSAFLKTCEIQLDGFVADPFGRNAA